MFLLSGAGQGSSNSPNPKAQSICLLVQDLLKLERFDAVFCSTLEKGPAMEGVFHVELQSVEPIAWESLLVEESSWNSAVESCLHPVSRCLPTF